MLVRNLSFVLENISEEHGYHTKENVTTFHHEEGRDKTSDFMFTRNFTFL